MKFIDKVITRIEKVNSHLCVGLDSRYDRIPDAIKGGRSVTGAIFSFNKNVIEATHHVAAAYKSNISFYAGFGEAGLRGLQKTNAFLKKNYPDIPVFADCKRSEMGESVQMVKQELIDWLGFDCVMATPWFGVDTVKDYLQDERVGVCVYVHDSNPSAIEFQDLELANGRKVYEVVAEHLKTWNTNGNVMAEAGATYLHQLKRIRKILGEEMLILIAGIGPQGGKPQDLVGLFGRNRQRLLVNSSRGIIFAGKGKKNYFVHVQKAAEDLRNQLIEASQQVIIQQT